MSPNALFIKEDTPKGGRVNKKIQGGLNPDQVVNFIEDAHSRAWPTDIPDFKAGERSRTKTYALVSFNLQHKDSPVDLYKGSDYVPRISYVFSRTQAMGGHLCISLGLNADTPGSNHYALLGGIFSIDTKAGGITSDTLEDNIKQLQDKTLKVQDFISLLKSTRATTKHINGISEAYWLKRISQNSQLKTKRGKIDYRKTSFTGALQGRDIDTLFDLFVAANTVFFEDEYFEPHALHIKSGGISMVNKPPAGVYEVKRLKFFLFEEFVALLDRPDFLEEEPEQQVMPGGEEDVAANEVLGYLVENGWTDCNLSDPGNVGFVHMLKHPFLLPAGMFLVFGSKRTPEEGTHRQLIFLLTTGHEGRGWAPFGDNFTWAIRRYPYYTKDEISGMVTNVCKAAPDALKMIEKWKTTKITPKRKMALAEAIGKVRLSHMAINSPTTVNHKKTDYEQFMINDDPKVKMATLWDVINLTMLYTFDDFFFKAVNFYGKTKNQTKFVRRSVRTPPKSALIVFQLKNIMIKAILDSV